MIFASYKASVFHAAKWTRKLLKSTPTEMRRDTLYHDAFEGRSVLVPVLSARDMQRATTNSPFYGMVVIDDWNTSNQPEQTTDSFPALRFTQQPTADADYNNWWRALFIAASHPQRRRCDFADLVAGAIYCKIVKRRFEFLQCSEGQYPVPPERNR